MGCVAWLKMLMPKWSASEWRAKVDDLVTKFRCSKIANTKHRELSAVT